MYVVGFVDLSLLSEPLLQCINTNHIITVNLTRKTQDLLKMLLGQVLVMIRVKGYQTEIKNIFHDHTVSVRCSGALHPQARQGVVHYWLENTTMHPCGGILTISYVLRE
jgi:hypothetical protein